MFLKRTKLYAGVTLAIQSITFLFMVIFFLFKNKKNTAGVFMLMSLVGGLASAWLLAKEFQEEKREHLLDDIVDGIYDEEPIFDDSMPVVPVDDTADEGEFN